MTSPGGAAPRPSPKSRSAHLLDRDEPAAELCLGLLDLLDVNPVFELDVLVRAVREEVRLIATLL